MKAESLPGGFTFLETGRRLNREAILELERQAIFKRAWLNVGRIEQLPKTGSYFTKNIEIARSSLIVVRDGDGTVRAFHNVCRHRGNRLLWNDFPAEETEGFCRQFVCKYHGWRYGLDGELKRMQTPLDYRLERDAIRLVVGPPDGDQ